MSEQMAVYAGLHFSQQKAYVATIDHAVADPVHSLAIKIIMGYVPLASVAERKWACDMANQHGLLGATKRDE